LEADSDVVFCGSTSAYVGSFHSSDILSHVHTIAITFVKGDLKSNFYRDMPAPTQPLTPDPTPAKEPSTPDETPSKPPKFPQKLTRTDTEFSSTSEMADSDDPGYQSRSRSQSRRRRRQNQRQRQAASRADASNGVSAESMASIGEANELEPEPTTITRQPGQRLVSKRAPNLKLR
jgi:hypothetical protein